MREEKKGFTLIELVISLGLVSLLCSVAFAFSFQNIRSNSLLTATQGVVFSLRQAQTFARAGEGDVPWGVYVQSGSITVFAGGSYATRDTSLDRLLSISDDVVFSGDTEFVFSAFSGEPYWSGGMVLAIPDISSTSVSVNVEGTVIY